MPVEEQVVSLYAATHGSLDGVEVEQVSKYEAALLDWFRTRHGDILEGIRTTGDIGDVEAFEAAIAGFTDQFTGADTTPGPSAGATSVAPPVDPATGVVLGDAVNPDAETPGEIGEGRDEPAAVDPSSGIAVGDVDEDR
jgi:F-type H+-transporting ATPase subunit alpha